MTRPRSTPPWTETGRWIVKDEDGRFHWIDCECVAGDGLNCCRSRTMTPFPDERSARAHAELLEVARGYACKAEPLLVR